MTRFLHVFWIVGRRTFLGFAGFTFLCVATIAATYVVSRHALKAYVEDQLDRIEWDMVVRQTREMATGPTVLASIREEPHVKRAESLAFLRTRLPPGLRAEAGSSQVIMPWFVVLSATNPRLLPPEYRAERGRTALAFFGMADAVQYHMERLQDAHSVSFLQVEPSADHHSAPPGEHGSGHAHDQHDGVPRELIRLPVSQIVQLDRDELNRWFLERTGIISFVPFVGVALNVGDQPSVVARLDGLFNMEMHQHPEHESDDPGHEEHGEYVPETNHVVAVDRTALISGWDLEGSYERVSALKTRISQRVPFDAGAVVRSDTEILLAKMRRSAELIAWVTLLLALPVVVMAWVFAANLVRLVFLNERRTVGLMRLRGLAGPLLTRAVLVAVLLGGLVGGVLGLALGTAVPLALYEGVGAVPGLFAIQRPVLAGLFLFVGLGAALVIGTRLANRMRELTPGEAVRRHSVVAIDPAMSRRTWLAMCAVALGAYKIASWWFGSPPGLERLPILRLLNTALDFTAVPLLIYGVAALVASRRTLLVTAIRWMRPLCFGRLKDFAVEEISTKTTRVTDVFLVGSLAAAIVLAPSVASESFTDKALRGARVSVGADVQVFLNTLDVDGQPRKLLASEVARVQASLQQVLAQLRQREGVRSATGLLKAMLPIYMPGHSYSGVPLFLLTDPAEYRRDVYAEESLGVDLPFSAILDGIRQGGVAVSRSVADFYQARAGDSLVLGLDAAGRPIQVRVAGILASVPGAPRRTVSDRDSFVSAMSHYLNYLFVEDAFIVSSMDNPAFSTVNALVPQMVALVRSPVSLGDLRELAMPARAVNLLSDELARAQRDMFVFLVAENLKIYLFGGFVVALAAIVAIFIVTYWEGRRTFALLRVRGSSPIDLIGALSLQLYAPLVWSLFVGGAVGAIAGYGVAHRIWSLQRVLTVIQQLPTRLIVTSWDAALVIIILSLLSIVVVLMGVQVFRRSPREAIVSE